MSQPVQETTILETSPGDRDPTNPVTTTTPPPPDQNSTPPPNPREVPTDQ